jgi:hypothetical protein
MLSAAKRPNKSPKREYIFLAALYLSRDGLNINEVTFIWRETYLNDILPNLHVLNEYGFDKGKYTKADKFLRSFFNTLLVGANPLFFYGAHQIADLQRAILSIFDVVFTEISKVPDDPKFVDAGILLELAMSYRYTVPLLVMRNTVLAGRDFMISILMFF